MRWLLNRRLVLQSTWVGLAALALLGPPGAALAQTQPAVRVGSKIDTEGLLLGELIIRTLQAHGIKTENRLQLGSTQIVRAALIAGRNGWNVLNKPTTLTSRISRNTG